MLKFLLFYAFTFVCFAGTAQQVTFERFILGTGGQLNDTLDNGTVVTLDLSTDDAEQENDEVDSYYDDDLDAGWEGAPEDQNLLTLGLRFADITVPQGAVIDSCFIVLHAHEGKSAEDVAILTIVAEAADNAVTFDEDNFNDSYLLTDRPQTDAAVEWTVAEDWTIWQPYKTADIAPVVQEIVNRPGWAPGNAIAFILLPQNQGPSIVENAREFTSFENIADPEDVDPEGNFGDGTNHPERRPYIQIYYQGTVSTVELNPSFFNAYPNPTTNGQLNLDLVNDAPASVRVIDAVGKVARTFDVRTKKSELDLTGLAEGIYLINIIQNNQSSVKRIVIR
ncbi:MAG: T9SS type A sorting domain-containing protein [Cryomorphaceae bacterium]